MNKNVKIIGPYAKITFEHSMTQIVPGQCMVLDGKYFAVYDNDHASFTVLVKSSSHLVENDPKEISGPTGKGFTSCLHKRAVVVAGGTGIGAIVPVIRARNKYGLTTDIIFYSKGDITPIRADQATIGMCRNVIFWNTTEKGRPPTPLSPLPDRLQDAAVYVAGPKSLVDDTQKAAKGLNYICYTNI